MKVPGFITLIRIFGFTRRLHYWREFGFLAIPIQCFHFKFKSYRIHDEIGKIWCGRTRVLCVNGKTNPVPKRSGFVNICFSVNLVNHEFFTRHSDTSQQAWDIPLQMSRFGGSLNQWENLVWLTEVEHNINLWELQWTIRSFLIWLSCSTSVDDS